jgi:hypothetical protein
MKYQKYIIRALIAGFLMMVCLWTASPVVAQNGAAEREAQLQAAGGPKGAGLIASDPRWIVANIVRLLLSLVGIILFCFMFYAGYLWLTAAGNEEQVEHAKTIIKNSIMGLLVVLVSLSITQFILFYANWATSGNPNGGPSAISPPAFGP